MRSRYASHALVISLFSFVSLSPQWALRACIRAPKLLGL